MNNDSKWGDPRDCQVKVFLESWECFTKEVEIPERRIFGVVVRKAGKRQEEVYGKDLKYKGGVIPDDAKAHRKFRYRCGLVKAINVLSGTKSTMTLYLDSFINTSLDLGKTEFRFDPQLEDGPVVEISYWGFCTRRGGMPNKLEMAFASLIFKDQNQMKEFVVAITTTPDPEQKMVYRSDESSDSGESCLWPFAAGVLLGTVISD